ncbi:MAG: hypothetical protein ABI397_03550 [Candidatus Saccharimonas sp.]
MNIELPSIQLSQIPRAISHFLHRYHVVVFACIVLGGLSITTLMLYKTIATPDSTMSGAPASSADHFDQDTIEKIKQLRSATEDETPLQLPAGRTNPFQ